jgi:LPXTG-motif cell wall-anchored protein
MTVLGATALLVAGLMGSPAAAFAAPVAGAPVAVGDPKEEQTCPEEGKLPGSGEQTSVTVTAPEGMVIVGYCVKAGSATQGEGPETFDVDPSATEVTISHSSGKAISHYTVFYEAAPTDEAGEGEDSSEEIESGDGTESEEDGTESGEDTEAVEDSTEGEGTEEVATPVNEGTESGEDAVESGEGADEAAAPVDEADGTESAEEPPVLAATGASTAIGFTLIALALVGGGVTLIVLRRKGVLGS